MKQMDSLLEFDVNMKSIANLQVNSKKLLKEIG